MRTIHDMQCMLSAILSTKKHEWMDHTVGADKSIWYDHSLARWIAWHSQTVERETTKQDTRYTIPGTLQCSANEWHWPAFPHVFIFKDGWRHGIFRIQRTAVLLLFR